MGFSVLFFDYIQLITLVEEIFVFDVYRFSATRDRPFIIDCGSNIGLSVLYFKALYPASRILAFEPDPQAFELLESNIRNNKLEGVICYNEAATNNVGFAELFRGEIPGSLGMSLIEMPTNFRQTVHTVRLSEFIHNDVDLLKIDVEGSEIQIIEDLLETRTIQFVKQMVIEFHPSKITRDIQDFLDTLGDYDFDVYERNEAFPKSTDRLFYFTKRHK